MSTDRAGIRADELRRPKHIEPGIVPPGFKRTAIGPLPIEWDMRSLGPLVTITSGESPSLFRFGFEGTPYFKVEQLNNSSKYLGSEGTEYFIDNASRSVPAGSVLFPKRGASIMLNKVRILKADGYMDTNMMALTPGNQLDGEYLFYVLSHLGLASVADVTSIPQINNKHISPFAIPYPSYAEQRAIAQALSDVDGFLEALKALIAKKRAIKQAAMQQLLTGKTRLPGFRGKWKRSTLGAVAEALEAGVSVNSIEEQPSSGAPCVLKTSALAGGTFFPHEAKRIAARDISRARTSPERDTILISRMNTPDLVGEVAYVERDYPRLFLPDRIWMTRFRKHSALNVQWLAHVLSSLEYRRLVKAAATGTSGSMKNIPKNALLALPIQFPIAEEQAAIAAVLSDMSAEIAALARRHDKTRAIKQGMMQQLLTGRVRLVESTPSRRAEEQV